MFEEKYKTKKIGFKLPKVQCSEEWLKRARASHKRIVEKYAQSSR